MTTYTNGNTNSDDTEIRQQATELRDFLMTDIASKLHPEARAMAGWLSILLTSTPDAEELLETEVNSVIFIMGG